MSDALSRTPASPFPFRRVAVVNRGEAAMRLIRALKEIHHEQQVDLVSIALYTEPEARAMFVREADHAISIGSPTFIDPADGRRKNRYLDYSAIERALHEARADAVWVGWGFVAEHAAFAELCRKLGRVFIGPSPETMRALGDKIGSKRMAEAAGVPLAPWSDGPVEDLAAAHSAAARIGYPLMVKATAGGGGRGIRLVRSELDLAEAFTSARAEALAGFGDETVFLERRIEGARHIEVQILGDGQGTTWALGVRDCTVQRRNQKVIEESPSPALTRGQMQTVCEAAVRLGTRAGYCGAGTVEFLYDPRDRGFSFMEVNARLQVEHPVTECTSGVDLVKLQLYVASGGRLGSAPPEPHGHAIEVRINAEDPERGFAPAPGEIALFAAPGGPGIRIDSGFAVGDRVAPEFDSMLAKVIAHGRDRVEALARLRRALREMKLVVRGGANNRGFLLGLLGRDEVSSGRVDVGWLDRLALDGAHLTHEHADIALVVAAVEAYDQALARERDQFYATAARGRLRVPKDVGYEFKLRLQGIAYSVRALQTAPRRYALFCSGHRIELEVERLGPLERRLLIGSRQHYALTYAEGPDQIVEVDGIPHRVSRDDIGLVRSPAPAVVLQICVEAGQDVGARERVAVLEAMKTELPVLAPCSGRVANILVSANVQVDAGAPLLVLEPSGSETDEERGEPLDLGPLASTHSELEDSSEHSTVVLAELRYAMLGFDVDPSDLQAWMQRHEELSRRLPPDDPELLRYEHEILALFADTCALFEHRSANSRLANDEDRTPQEFLLLYLRSLDARTAGVSPSFTTRLERALAHYDVTSIERSEQLEAALLWLCRAHAHVSRWIDTVFAVLERRLSCADVLSAGAHAELRDVLDRIVSATTGIHQAVSDLARAVRYRYFDRPFYERIQADAYAHAGGQLEASLRAAATEGRGDWVHALVELPHPLAPQLLRRLPASDAAGRELCLEILLRRYYRIRELEAVHTFTRGGRSHATASYAHPDGFEIEVLASHTDLDAIDACFSELSILCAELPEGREFVIEIFVPGAGTLPEPGALAAQLEQKLALFSGACAPRRVVVTVASPGTDRGMNALGAYTFRWQHGRPEEETTLRGLHPMMAKRLQLWRLSNFDIERLPSVEDVYLFHGVARSNPKDERLFAFAEVRDLTPMHGQDADEPTYPHLEMQFLEALAAIRLFQGHRSARRRLQWNRVVLYVWPPSSHSVDDMYRLAHRLLPAAEGLGLQKTVLRARVQHPETQALRDVVIQISSPAGRGVLVRFTPVAYRPISPLSAYDQQVVRMRERGLAYPYEIIRMLTPDREATRTEFPVGEFTEYDMDEQNCLVPVARPPGQNRAKIVVGIITNFTQKHPEGMRRVSLLGDPSRDMGSFAEPECRRIIAAVELAERLGLPLEWFPISAGAKIAMDSGTENLDWTAAALRSLVEFTQRGGEVNLIVVGINVGGQSYWNAEATMLMHNRGILIMTPEASMVLTGKKALDYSGGVSAEDHQGIGGYDRVMGVNGEAQYWAASLEDACRILFRYYEHSYVSPGERFPRRATTNDPIDRDIRSFPYGEGGDHSFETVGEIFSSEHNPARRRPFEVRRVMRAVIDHDHEPMERWADMREAEIAAVWDAHLGGMPICLIGIESRPLARLGFVPADGPDQWTAATLFPLASKKVARAINAASGSRPIVVLANLSGFDGSPESLRRLQLEYGAEIGRAVVNFDGPILFCVIGRYHGGAYVVFSRRLNPHLEVAALDGSYASVIGGAPAAAVVFAGEVDRRTRDDPRLRTLEAEITATRDDTARSRLRARWHTVYDAVHSEKLGELAEEFDRIHSVQRAKAVGSIDAILSPMQLRPWLAEAIARGMRRVAQETTDSEHAGKVHEEA